MADQLQLRGGTTNEHSTFTGALREVTVDTDKDTLIVHDAATAGGHPLAKEDLSNVPTGTITSTMIADGTIVNADINASAEIAVSKLADGAARQLLQTDAAGTGVEWTNNVDVPGTLDVTSVATFDNIASHSLGAAATPSITFTGDTNTGLYSPGADQVAISTNGTGRLFVDASGNVGVGSSTIPRGTISIYGATAPLIHFWNSTTTSGSGNGTSIYGFEDDFVIQNRETSGAIAFQTANTERLRITSDGKVGVGTSSPGSLSSAANNLVVGNGAAGSEGITIYSGTQGNLYFADGTTGDQLYRGYVLYSHTNDRLELGAGGSTGLSIDSSQRVGVGTTSPGYELDVQGASDPSIRIRSSGTGAGDDSILRLQIGGTTASNYIFFGDSVDSDIGQIRYNHSNDSLNFTTNTSLAATIDSSGRVGIGTSSPTSNIHVVNSSASAGLTLQSTAYSANYSLFSGATGTNKIGLYDNTASAYRLIVDSSGNVGIGTTSPRSTLELGTGHIVLPAFGRIGTGGSGDTPETAFRFTSADNISAIVGNSEKLRIDNSGRLLVGTSTARTNFNTGGNTAEFQVEGVGKGSFMRNLNDQYGSDLFLTKSRSTGNSIVSNNDIVGNISFQGNDGTNFVPTAIISAQIDGTPGSNDMPGRLVFSTTADGASSPTERMRIRSDGTILINTNSTDPAAATGFQFTSAGVSFASVNASTSGNNTLHVYSTNASAYRFYVGMDGTVNATNTTISAISDQRLKENIRDLDTGLNEIMALQPRRFDWKAGKGKDIQNDQGFIAQEFEQVFPEMIGEWLDPAPEGEEPYKSVRADLVPVLVKAIQEQQAIINGLEARLAALETN